MRRVLVIGLSLLASWGAPGRAQDAQDDIRSIIARQIEALQADDLETAFSFASPGIRRMFGSPDRFGAMVERGYPMVRRPADFRFSSLRTRDGRTVQSVVVTDQSGALHVLDYDMIDGDDGWRINGVMLRRPGDAGA